MKIRQLFFPLSLAGLLLNLIAISLLCLLAFYPEYSTQESNLSLLVSLVMCIAAVLVWLAIITERKLLEQALLAIAENQQRSLGQDLHDNLGQQLASIGYQVNVLEKKLRNLEDDEPFQVAKTIAEQVKNAVVQCKELARGLLPYELESLGLTNSLHSLAKNIEANYHTTCEFICKDDIKIDDHEVALNIYRIAQEATNNAVRHAGATQIQIKLERMDPLLTLVVSDNGIGLNESNLRQLSSKGMGIRIMRHRANQLDAKLEIVPLDTGGTEVHLDMRQK
jgi:signal transduction histidine kinase